MLVALGHVLGIEGSGFGNVSEVGRDGTVGMVVKRFIKYAGEIVFEINDLSGVVLKLFVNVMTSPGSGRFAIETRVEAVQMIEGLIQKYGYYLKPVKIFIGFSDSVTDFLG